MGFLMFFHAIICIVLVVLVLIQQGKGGGLIEMASGMESIFGTKTSSFITKTTTILATIYFVSCLLIAVVSSRASHSLMEGSGKVKTKSTQSQAVSPQQGGDQATNLPAAQAPAEAAKATVEPAQAANPNTAAPKPTESVPAQAK